MFRKVLGYGLLKINKKYEGLGHWYFFKNYLTIHQILMAFKI